MASEVRAAKKNINNVPYKTVIMPPKYIAADRKGSLTVFFGREPLSQPKQDIFVSETGYHSI